ncbi:uncharacterized protein VTP21DRAFT_2716 [Calcarisporiella thermophila]|uniref:uncharacterized protein n=1 Tax=Calcarisporiella thermophila TaxID=911321 RepID=UPI0037437371
MSNGEIEIDPAVLNQLEEIEKEMENVERDLVKQQIKLTGPIYKKRAEIVATVPKFWLQVLGNHPVTNQLIEHDDVEILEHLETLDVVRDEENPDNYKIELTFSENPFFTNKTLVKEITTDENDVSTAKTFAIDWKEGKDVTKKETGSFFQWFSEDEDSDLGELIRDDIFPNAFRYYQGIDEEDDDDEEIDLGEDDEDEE